MCDTRYIWAFAAFKLKHALGSIFRCSVVFFFHLIGLDLSVLIDADFGSFHGVRYLILSQIPRCWISSIDDSDLHTLSTLAKIRLVEIGWETFVSVYADEICCPWWFRWFSGQQDKDKGINVERQRQWKYAFVFLVFNQHSTNPYYSIIVHS